MVSGPPTKACRGCGAPIVWAKIGGKNVPLDPRPACYFVFEQEGEILAERQKGVYVGHMEVCQSAAEFSKSPKKVRRG